MRRFIKIILTVTKISPLTVKAEDDPFHLHNDLNKMMHDLSVLGKLRSLVSTLQRSYEVGVLGQFTTRGIVYPTVLIRGRF